MSEPDEEVAVTVEGVTVRKTVNDHEFETLAVVFDISSGREDRVHVTVAEDVPEGVAEDDIGFHPEYGAEHWSAGDGEVVFERTFVRGDEYTTVYGIRGFDGDRDELLEEPWVEVVAGETASMDDLVSEEDSAAVKGVIAGESDSLPGMGEGPAAEADEPADAAEDEAEAAGGEAAESPIEEDEPDEGPAIVEPEATTDPEEPADEEVAEPPGEPEPAIDEPSGAIAPEEPAETGEPAEPEPSTAAGDDEPAGEVTVPITGGIARVLAKELREGDVSREDRRLLREELLPDDGSTDARIRTLQNKVGDLEAYADALEEFLDEEGDAWALIDGFRDDVEELSEDVEAVDGRIVDVEDDLDDLESVVDAAEVQIDSLEDEVGAVTADVGAVEGRVDGVERDIEAVEDDLAAVDALEGRVGSIEDDVAEIRDELAELATFRDRLSSVFGPGGVGGGVGDLEEE